mmetsp:Transcript_39053/g.45532  ORF Transcript_39053/g.45532 Transcript_39053/m.45532 type:complete len:372 (+) Transcript_39053:160-1275(+)|eukprot:CAMPEP_0194390262 /NCGR_PEP_ID=MMETSP0174-20130528/108940_1 /TAXON_ID=216777 /ORGANISM="Proboscia alata, Strain PI-D3" /LENGTH=371 /DNA_ID=CAMNT_0039183417 /DNA_START=114 /DNA_END=1229 /DNA_ORIENTATION=+
MVSSTSTNVFTVASVLSLLVGLDTFTLSSSFAPAQQNVHKPQISSKTSLFGRPKGRLLAEDFTDDKVVTTQSAETRSKRSSGTKKKKNTKVVNGVSSDLAAWMEKGSTSEGTERVSSVEPSIELQNTKPDKAVKAVKTNPKSKRNIGRRSKQAEKKAASNIYSERADVIIKQLTTLFEDDKWDATTVLSEISSLIENANEREQSESVGSTNVPEIRTIAGGGVRRSYKMAWAGSDDTICHMGTGLHNVPLARLQEVFLSIGQSRAELYEVISIIGPFPNVKNTLRGSVSTISNGKTLKLTYDSMVDGTGKEILAGKEENVRKVELDILFASSGAILARVPGDSDPMKESGKDLVLFVEESDLSLRLEVYRV